MCFDFMNALFVVLHEQSSLSSLSSSSSRFVFPCVKHLYKTYQRTRSLVQLSHCDINFYLFENNKLLLVIAAVGMRNAQRSQ